MIRFALLAAGLMVSACAQPQPAAVLPIEPIDPIVTPVSFAELRGQSVMVLDRTDPNFAVQQITTYLRACKSGTGERIVFNDNGLQLVDTSDAPRLILMIAQRGPVTGIALDGPDFTPIYQEELAQAVQGRSTCA